MQRRRYRIAIDFPYNFVRFSFAGKVSVTAVPSPSRETIRSPISKKEASFLHRYSPMPVEKQIAILYCGTHGLLRDVPLDKVGEFERNFLEFLEMNYRMEVLDVLKTGVINDDVCKKIEETAEAVARQFSIVNN